MESRIRIQGQIKENRMIVKLLLAACVFCFILLTGCSEPVYGPHHYPPPEAGQPHADNMPRVYCSRCGVLPGRSTQCPRFSSHDFVSAGPSVAVVCGRCGVFPTPEPTQCPRYSSHDFITIKPGTVLVCSHCGAAPSGRPTSCPRFSSHDFKEFQ